MLIYQQTLLYKTAAEVGADVNNPEGGPAYDMLDDDIIEMIIDIANGNCKLGVTADMLTEIQRERVLDTYNLAAKRAAR